MTNILQNGSFDLGTSAWSGFYNLVDAPTAADDIYVGKPLSNLALINGEAVFAGVYDPSGPGSYAYRLAPPSPHLAKSVYLEAGTYTLSFDFRAQSSGMNIAQLFEVRMDGVQVSTTAFWAPVSPGVYGTTPAGLQTVTLTVATAGMHQVSFGMTAPGFNLDTRFSYAQYANRAFLDNVSLTATSAAITGTEAAEALAGTSAGDLLWGLGGNDTLEGGAGSDTLQGGAGNDLYLVREAGDLVIETAGGGTDTVRAWVSQALSAEVENLRLMGTANLSATGNALNNVITANEGQNDIDGGLGRDTVSFATSFVGVSVDLSALVDGWAVTSGLDRLRGIEDLVGSALADTLVGDAGANSLDGGAGADDLLGQGGSDSYRVDDAGDLVTELAGQGAHDLVQSLLAAYTLGANVEDGRILATGAADLTGNGLNNLLFAGAGDNLLDGLAGRDTLSYRYATGAVVVDLSTVDAGGWATVTGSGTDLVRGVENIEGGAFADRLTGDAGDNVLDGGAGSDTLTGGDGSDTYYVDAALPLVSTPLTAPDVVVETNAAPAGGFDTVMLRSVSAYGYTLGANIESGRLLMATAADLRGNGLDNLLFAGAGNNILNGDAGVDTVSYRHATAGVVASLDTTGPQATGGSGTDTLFFVENLAGSLHADTLKGNATANTLDGDDGDDVLNGRGGSDLLIGGAGGDRFVFDAALDGSLDTLQDFASGADRIFLDDAVFAGLGLGPLTAGQLRLGPVAVTAEDRLIYDQATGALSFDADGNGAGGQVQFAVLMGLPSLAAADFLVI